MKFVKTEPAKHEETHNSCVEEQQPKKSCNATEGRESGRFLAPNADSCIFTLK